MQNNKIITQIGSLPYDDPGEAMEYSLKHDIPFLPELPLRGDNMLEYIKTPGKLSCLKEFKNAVKKQGCKTVKIQCIGPVTLILSGYKEDEAIQRAYEHITAIMDGLEAQEVILFLDEPALGQTGFDYKKMWDALFSSFDMVPGVHTCGNMNWDEMFDSNLEIISFDASKYEITTWPRYRGNKRIAWGIREREDVKDFREGDLLTLPCGTSPKFYTPKNCGIYLEMLKRVSKELQQF